MESDYSPEERRMVLDFVFIHFSRKMGLNGLDDIFAALRDYPADGSLSFEERFEIMRVAVEAFTITDVVNRYRDMVDSQCTAGAVVPDDSPGAVGLPDEPGDGQGREGLPLGKHFPVVGEYAFDRTADTATFTVSVKVPHFITPDAFFSQPLATFHWENKELHWQISQIKGIATLFNFVDIRIDTTAHGDAVAQIVSAFFPLVTRVAPGGTDSFSNDHRKEG